MTFISGGLQKRLEANKYDGNTSLSEAISRPPQINLCQTATDTKMSLCMVEMSGSAFSLEPTARSKI